MPCRTIPLGFIQNAHYATYSTTQYTARNPHCADLLNWQLGWWWWHSAGFRIRIRLELRAPARMWEWRDSALPQCGRVTSHVNVMRAHGSVHYVQQADENEDD